ncbi:MAG TPA: ATP-binding protein [Bacillota bacterium]|nr:ATP-binding protein [Bacillota bacterium]
MSSLNRKSLGFQLGGLVALVLVITVLGIIAMNTVSSTYNKEVLAARQDKLKVTGQSLSKGLAIILEKGRSPVEIKSYFQEQADAIISVNHKLLLGLYLPEIGPTMYYGEISRENRFLFFRPKGDAQGTEFFGTKLTELKQAQSIERKLGAGVVLGRAEPVISGGRVRGVVMVIENMPDSRVTGFIVRAHQFLVVLALLLGIILTATVLRKLKARVREITSGLERLEQESSYRLEVKSHDEMGQIAQAINKMADTVEQKRLLEEELERSGRLAALGRLVTGVAHEIRNPLGIIKATVQVMEGELRDKLPEMRKFMSQASMDDLKEFLNVLNEQVERQNKIIRELLDYAKPIPPVFLPLNLRDQLESVLNLSKAYFQQNNVKVVLEGEQEVPPVEGDVQKLKQVFLNLIFNAVEAMPGGGTLTIRLFLEGNQVSITFCDTGKGIPPEHLDQLFDPFFTTKNTGTGLGLSMVHKALEMHKGTISVTTASGEGACFKIILPGMEEGGMAHGGNNPDN